MAGAFASWARDSALGPAVLNEVLKTGVTYELQQVHAFSELLAARDAKVAELEKRTKKHAKHAALQASGASETKGSRFAGYAPKALVSQKQPLADVLAQEAAELQDAEGAQKKSSLSQPLALALSLRPGADLAFWSYLFLFFSTFVCFSSCLCGHKKRRSGVRERRAARV